MAYSVGTPGSKEWWLHRLVQRLMDRQMRYDYLEAYNDGNHPLPDGDERYVKALKSMQRKARTNYIELINSAPIERMRNRGFRINGEMDQDAADIWSANNMDFQAPLMYQVASAMGDNYLMVSPAQPDPLDPFSSDLPVITSEDPRTCIIESDPANPQKTRAALRMWQDDVLGRVVALLFLPGGSGTRYVGPTTAECEELDRPSLTKKLLSGAEGGGLTEVSSFQLEIPVIPIVRLGWRPSYKDLSKSESETVLDIQDRINSTVLDRMVISRSQAYKQRWAKGIKLPVNKGGQRKPPFDPGADMLWISESADAEFGEFSEADIRQILEAVRDDVTDMAAITKTPPHYLMGKLANVSGSTLTQAEAGLTSKTRLRMVAAGWAIERVMRICFLYMGNTEKATASSFETLWFDPELHNKVESADAFSKEVTGGIPAVVAAERLGLLPDQLEDVEEQVEEQKELEAEQKEFDQKVALAAAKKPAAPGGSTPR